MAEKDLTQVNSSEDEQFQDGEDLENQEDKGEATTPEDGEKVEGEGKEKEPEGIDWESDDNPYKKRYGDSQSQVTPLVRTLT